MDDADEPYVVHSESVEGYADLAALSGINIAVWEANQDSRKCDAELERMAIDARDATDRALYAKDATMRTFAMAYKTYLESQEEFLVNKYRIDGKEEVWAKIGKAMAAEYFSTLKINGRPKKAILNKGYHRSSSLKVVETFRSRLKDCLSDLKANDRTFPLKIKLPRPYLEAGYQNVEIDFADMTEVARLIELCNLSLTTRERVVSIRENLRSIDRDLHFGLKAFNEGNDYQIGDLNSVCTSISRGENWKLSNLKGLGKTS